MSSDTTAGYKEIFAKRVGNKSLQDWAIDLGPFAMLVILIIYFSIQSNTFFTYNNIVLNVFRNSAVLLLVALAGTFPIIQQSIDLSVAGIVSIAGIVTAMYVPQFGVAAVLIGLLMGAIVGAFNGIVFTKLKIPSFLVTLGTLEIIGGISLFLTGGSTIPFRNENVLWIASGSFLFGVPNIVSFSVIIWVLTIVLAMRTKFGRYCYALGESERVTELSGVSVDRYKIYTFVLSGLLCGAAGALLASRIGSASSGMGEGLLLQSIAAIVMGGTALTGGVGGPQRTVIGVLVIAILTNGMNITGVDEFMQSIVLGIVVIGAVALSIDRRKISVVK